MLFKTFIIIIIIIIIISISILLVFEFLISSFNVCILTDFVKLLLVVVLLP